MSFEYRISFDHADRASIVSALRRLPLNALDAVGKFEFRSTDNQGGMPNAFIQVEDYGVYYCWNGGRGDDLLGALVGELVANFGPVTVEEL